MMRVAVSIKLRFNTLIQTGSYVKHAGYIRLPSHRCSSQELDVERTGDIEFFGNLAADFLNLAGSSKIDVLCREDKCRITRVYTGKFDVF